VNDTPHEPGGLQPGEEDLTPAEYCRRVEAYLCRRNDGHLVRIVGPVFDRVCGWATTGIPLKVVYRGIDRYFERYYAKGPRRWPVRVEFCENDVLDVFDGWRRAVGVALAPGRPGAEQAPGEGAQGEGPVPRRGPTLTQHLERAALRLSSTLAGTRLPEPLASCVGTVAREVDELRGRARGARGEARRAIVSRLEVLDATLADAAAASVGETELDAVRAEAGSRLAPHRARMPDEEYDRAEALLAAQLMRERFGLPVLRWE
jgi:hypothetical protein